MKEKSLIAVEAFLMTCFGCSTEKNSKDQKPNILFDLVGDLGWRGLGYRRSTFYEIPNIDKQATEGRVVVKDYAACLLCSSSKKVIMSGKYSSRLNLADYIPGIWHWGTQESQKLASHPFVLQLDSEEYTLAEAFKDVGYKPRLPENGILEKKKNTILNIKDSIWILPEIQLGILLLDITHPTKTSRSKKE